MSKKTKITAFLIMAGLVITAVAVKFWAQQACVEYTWGFTENFDTEDYKDIQNSVIGSWPAGPIHLPYLGANFSVTSPGGMGARIYVCDSGDFDGDGYPDLVGLDILGQFYSLSYQSRLMLIRNVYPTTGGVGSVFTVDPAEVYEDFNTHTGPAAITVADYNGDGLLDFFFARNSQDEFGYTNFMAAMYINVGTATDPDFRAHNVLPSLDFTAKFQATHIYLNWAANHFCSVDIDKDGDMDILTISQDRIFLARNPGQLSFALENWDVSELNYSARTGFTVGRGGSAIAAADFDNDGDIDIVGGTVNDIPYLVYYENDGVGHFTRKELAIPNPECTGTVGILAQDFTNNGYKDIIVVTDAWNAGNQAHLWMLRNHGLVESIWLNPATGLEETIMVPDWEFKCLNDCAPIIPPEYDVDISSAIDYDNDGDLDIVIADANHSGDYYLIINELAEVFALSGHAQSTNLIEGVIDPRRYAITRARITLLHQGLRGMSADGLKVELYLSNNNGRNWELYQTFEGSDIKTYADLPWYDFKHFGAEFKWKVIMTAEEDPMAEYENASFDSPFISEVRFELVYVDQKEYSRSSAAATVITKEGERKKLIVSASFIFPGFEGKLRAYDVTDMSMTGGGASSLNTVTSSDLGSTTGRDLASGVEIFWDAAELLKSRSADDRIIYTAIREGGDVDNPLTRLDFTRGNAATLAPFLADFQNDSAGLIDFVRGTGRDWKLGDINHSTPAVVGPPTGNPSLMGAGYHEFQQSLETRRKVIYVGADDGMLHSFDATTGEELWAFIPYNLLLKLKNMWTVDPVNGIRYLTHDAYVDGSPSVSDIQISGQWRTVLVCGQGPGKGSTLAGGGANHYFALDVTDPEAPQPLWEFTHTFKSGNNYYPSVGETWSVPAFGRVMVGSDALWAVFMGSGYDNTQSKTAGDRFYVVRADTGELLKDIKVSNVDTSGNKVATAYQYNDIKVAIPASPSAVDFDRDGRVDYVYFADLDGRVWRLDVTSTGVNQWAADAIYTDQYYYPIITKPVTWINPFSGSTYPYIFFGTGGDDNAPTDRTYAFICLRDTGSSAEVQWFMGDPTALNLPEENQAGPLSVGEKVWADPVVSDFIVYFSTLRGSIEMVNPCLNLGETGNLYARFVMNMAGSPMGSTALKGSGGMALESLSLVSKARQAVTVGEAQSLTGAVRKREVYIQEYDSTIQRLEQPISSILQIKSWREIYRIFR